MPRTIYRWVGGSVPVANKNSSHVALPFCPTLPAVMSHDEFPLAHAGLPHDAPAALDQCRRVFRGARAVQHHRHHAESRERRSARTRWSRAHAAQLPESLRAALGAGSAGGSLADCRWPTGSRASSASTTDGAAPNGRDEELYLSAPGPGRDAWVSIDRASGAGEIRGHRSRLDRVFQRPSQGPQHRPRLDDLHRRGRRAACCSSRSPAWCCCRSRRANAIDLAAGHRRHCARARSS